jgi:hypothetical protein
MDMILPIISGLAQRMLKNHDFSIILPSTSNKDTYPNNKANNFTVSWETPMILNNEDEWSVALTELTYTYRPYTITPLDGIKFYYYYSDSQSITAKLTYNNILSIKTAEAHLLNRENFRFTLPLVHIDKQGLVRIYSPFNFTLKFDTKLDAEQFGFAQKDYETSQVEFDAINGLYFISSTTVIDLNQKKIFSNMVLRLESKSTLVSKTFLFDRYIYCENSTNLVELTKLVENYGQQNLWIRSCDFDAVNKRISLTVGNNIQYFTFLGGLCNVLGFSDSTIHTIKEKTIIANHEPHLKRGINKMYICTNICEPTQIGDKRIPLLKDVWIDVNKGYIQDELINMEIKNPMYVSLNRMSINSIDISVYDNSGIFIPFPESAQTVVRLHFKKNGRQRLLYGSTK